MATKTTTLGDLLAANPPLCDSCLKSYHAERTPNPKAFDESDAFWRYYMRCEGASHRFKSMLNELKLL
jgi:hypothetical protein